MPDGRLSDARGKGAGESSVHAGTHEMQDGDSYDTGLSGLDAVVVSAENDGHIAAVSSTSGGSFTLSLYDDTGSSVNSDETIQIVAYGSP